MSGCAPGSELTRRAVLAFGGASAPRPPRRIVSLYPCLDAVLVRVADPGQIAALSALSRSPLVSTISEAARRRPVTYGSAEEIAALRPDLVFVSRYTSPPTVSALARLGIPTAPFEVATTVEASLAQVRDIAARVGRPERGRALVEEIAAALRAAAPPPGARAIPALVFQRGGFAAGSGMIVDDMLGRTGFRNVAARYGVRGWGRVELERLIADPPAVLLSGEVGGDQSPWADRIMRHPALAALRGRMVQAPLPERLMYCGGPVLIATAAALASARRLALARGVPA